MKLEFIQGNFSVCKTADPADIRMGDDFCFIGKTDGELSVVCRTESAPERTLAKEDGWTMFRVVGQMEFTLVGILSKITTVLAKEKIPVFAVSTFDTDYILIKKEKENSARTALQNAGYETV